MDSKCSNKIKMNSEYSIFVFIGWLTFRLGRFTNCKLKPILQWENTDQTAFKTLFISKVYKKENRTTKKEKGKKRNPSWTLNVLQAQKQNKTRGYLIQFNSSQYTLGLKKKTSFIITLVYPHVCELNMLVIGWNERLAVLDPDNMVFTPFFRI